MKTLLDQSIEKSRAGVYQDTSENRRKHRVGQHYGEAKKPEEEGEDKKSKREQRMERLLSYKQNLGTIEEALKRGMVAPENMEKIKALKETLEGKIAKLEAKLKIKKDEAPKTEPKSEPKKEEAKKEEPKKEEKPKHIGPVWQGKDGVLVEEMAEGKKPEFVQHGKIDPPSDPDWQKKAESIDWEKVDLADMGQTIEYLGKIGQFEDGSDMYGIRYYSPNGKKSSVSALGKADYLRNVQRAGFNVRESMRTAVDYISPDASTSTKTVAQMVLEGKTPAEIHDYVKSTHEGVAEGTLNRIIKRGYIEAEAAQIRMENEVNGIARPAYNKDESDPIPDAVKKLNQRSDEEDINEAIATYLGLEIDPKAWMRVKSEDVDKVTSFWERTWRHKGLSKTAVIDKLKKAYMGRQREANEEAAKTAMREYYASEKGQARLKAFKEKRAKAYNEFKNAATITSDAIKESAKKAGFELAKADVYSDGTARLFLKDSTRGGWGDAEVYYKNRWSDDEKGRTYEVQTTSFGSIEPGSPEAKAIALQGALLSNEALINDIKSNLEKVTSAEENFDRAQTMLENEFEDLYLEKKNAWSHENGELLNEALKVLGEEE